jgi:hypothetical protein
MNHRNIGIFFKSECISVKRKTFFLQVPSQLMGIFSLFASDSFLILRVIEVRTNRKSTSTLNPILRLLLNLNQTVKTLGTSQNELLLRPQRP